MSSPEYLYTLLCRFSKDLLLVVDPRTLQIAEASSELLKRLSYSREAIVGKPITDIDCSLASFIFWDELQKGNEDELENSEGELLTSTGAELPVSKNVKRIRDREKEWLIVEICDNTKVKDNEDALSMLSSQLKATLEAAGDGILVVSNSGEFINMNRRFSSLWNIPQQILKQGTQAINDWILGELIDSSAYEYLVKNLSKNSENKDPFVLELKNRKVFELRVYLQKSAYESEGYVLNFHDVTQHVQYEHALILEREKAEQTSQYKSDFMSNMSHELRTPLNAILGFTQIMELDPNLGVENLEFIHEILKAGDHLLELINEVLDLTKVESGYIELSSKEIDVSQLIKECLALVGSLTNELNIQLHYHNETDAKIIGDRRRLKQVLLNILSNAIKYNSDQGSVYISALSEKESRLCIHVRDTGPGIPAERMSELFQPFSRLDADKTNIQGTGIGLTLSRRLVELMKGSIGVESELGVGSTFSINLPLGHDFPIELNEPQKVIDDNKVENDKGDSVNFLLHILVVEDNLPNQFIARKFIEKMGCKVDIASNGYEAIKAVKSRPYDLILMDMRMPEMDGITATKEIRKLESDLKNIPIIAMTANTTKEDKDVCIQAGMNDFISKPIKFDQLKNALQNVVNQS